MLDICESLLHQAETLQRGGATLAADNALSMLKQCQAKDRYCAAWCRGRTKAVAKLKPEPLETVKQAQRTLESLNNTLASAFKEGQGVVLKVEGSGVQEVSIDAVRQLPWADVLGAERPTPASRPAPPRAPEFPALTPEELIDVSLHTARVQQVGLSALCPNGDGGVSITRDEARQIKSAVDGAVACLRRIGAGV